MENIMIYDKWNYIKETIRDEHSLTDIAYTTFIAPLEIASVTTNKVTILVPGNVMGESYYNRRFKISFMVAICEITNKTYEIEFTSTNPVKRELAHSPSTQLTPQPLGLIPKYTFEEYVVSDFNRAAHASGIAVSEQPGELFNPLYIFGKPGLGKTHMLHAMGHYMHAQNPSLNIVYITSEEFTNEIISAIQCGKRGDIDNFRDKYRNVDVLLIDDIQFIAGKSATQEEFFHTFNELLNKGKQVVITSDKPPKDLDNISERMKSRFVMGLIQELKEPDYSARYAIVQKRAEKLALNADNEVLSYIAQNITGNIRELSGAINKLLMLNRLSNQKITLEIAIREIETIITNKPQEISSSDILSIVAEKYNVSVEQICSKSRKANIALARQIVMYLCRTMTDMSQKEIGNILGGRDHSTINYGVNEIETRYQNDLNFRSHIDTIKKLLPGSTI